MNIMKLAWKFFVSKKSRAFFSILGVALGVMLLVISQILILTVERSNEHTLREKYGHYDMLVGYQTDKHHLTEDDITFINQIPGVKNSTPLLYPYIGEKMKMPEIAALPMYVGFKNDPLAKEHPFLNIDKGTFPKENEVILPIRYLKANHLEIGSEIELPFPPGNHKQKVVISGTLKQNEKLENIAVFAYDWLSKVTSNKGKATVLMLKLEAGASKKKINQIIKSKYPDIFIDNRTEMEKERENIGGLKPFVHTISISALAGSFLIVVSTLQMAILERKRELATLRLIGIKRYQLTLMIVVESMVVGCIGATVGVLLGIVLSFLSQRVVEQLMGFSLVGIVIPWKSLFLCAVSGIVVTVLAGIIPGYVASKLPPIVAYKQNEPFLDKYSFLVRWVSPVLFIASITVSIFNYLYTKGPEWIYLLTGLCFLLSTFMGIPVVLYSTAKSISFISKPFLGSEALLAGRNALRQIRKNIQIAGILMLAFVIGLTGYLLFSSIAIQAEKDIKTRYPMNYKLQATDPSLEPGFSKSLEEQMKQIEGISSISIPTALFGLTLNLDQNHIKNWNGQLFDINGEKQIHMSLRAININEVTKFHSIKVLEGTIDQGALQNDGVIITKDLKKLGFQLGDYIQIGRYDEVMKGKNAGHRFKIVGIIDKMPVLPSDEYTAYTDQENLEKYFKINTIEQIQYNISNPSLSSVIQKKIDNLLNHPDFSNVILYDRQKELLTLHRQVQQRLFILLAAVILTIFLAITGLMNNMASSLRERSREFAVLRALGSRPNQVMRLALLEGVIISLAGGLIGIISGLVFGYHVLAGLEAKEYLFPWQIVLIQLLISPLIGIAAALIPSIWISRMNLIKTLYQE